MMAQNCTAPTALKTLNANQNRMAVTNGGDLFSDFWYKKAGYSTLYPRTLFSTGLWMSGIDAGGNLHGSFPTYRNQAKHDFTAGVPNPNDGTLAPNSCTDFDKIWSVTRKEIEAHRADWKDNGKIDAPIAAVFNYPGLQNPFFKQYNNFNLPNHNSPILGYFKDVNSDAIYDPSQGEYPSVSILKAPIIIPKQLMWSAYSDVAAPHSDAKPMPIWVSQMVWADSCANSNVMNNTVFVQYKIHYYGAEMLDSAFIGLWADFDIGCYNDDYTGCIPSKNTFFGYNADETDGGGLGNCTGVLPWTGSIPVSAVTVLNQPLNSFITYNNSALSDAPAATLDPTKGADYYNYINGHWRDGSPIIAENGGYALSSSKPKTNFIFNGNPNDSTAWSMKSLKFPSVDRRAVGGIKIGKLYPGAINEVVVAFSNHRKTGNTVAQNIDLMYKAIDTIQSVYNGGFKNPCADASVGTQEMEKTVLPIQLAPNPFSQYLAIRNTSEQVLQVELLDVVGRTIAKKTLQGNEQFEFNTTSLDNGFYLVKASQNGKMDVRKVLKIE
jgi:hypothetical protein